MLEALITSKTRVRLLVRFFLNPTMKAYLRQLADEFGESTNSVRVELNRLTEAGILESEAVGGAQHSQLCYCVFIHQMSRRRCAKSGP